MQLGPLLGHGRHQRRPPGQRADVGGQGMGGQALSLPGRYLLFQSPGRAGHGHYRSTQLQQLLRHGGPDAFGSARYQGYAARKLPALREVRC